MQQLVQQLVSRGLKGAGAGFVLACVMEGVASFTSSETKPLVYKRKDGCQVPFRDLEALAEGGMVACVQTLAEHKDVAPKAFNEACRLMQYLVDVHAQFIKKRSNKEDGLREIARFERAAMRTDAAWRMFTNTLQNANDIAGHDRATDAAAELHKAFLSTLDSMRVEFSQQTQIDMPQVPSPP